MIYSRYKQIQIGDDSQMGVESTCFTWKIMPPYDSDTLPSTPWFRVSDEDSGVEEEVETEADEKAIRERNERIIRELLDDYNQNGKALRDKVIRVWEEVQHFFERE